VPVETERKPLSPLKVRSPLLTNGHQQVPPSNGFSMSNLPSFDSPSLSAPLDFTRGAPDRDFTRGAPDRDFTRGAPDRDSTTSRDRLLNPEI